MKAMNDQPHVKNVNLIEDATSTRAGVTGFNMHHALPIRDHAADRAVRFSQIVFMIGATAE